MSVALFRARQRIKAMRTWDIGGMPVVSLDSVIGIIDGEQEDEQERSFFRPLVKAEPPKKLDMDAHYASEQDPTEGPRE